MQFRHLVRCPQSLNYTCLNTALRPYLESRKKRSRSTLNCYFCQIATFLTVLFLTLSLVEQNRGDARYNTEQEHTEEQFGKVKLMQKSVCSGLAPLVRNQLHFAGRLLQVLIPLLLSVKKKKKKKKKNKAIKHH
eukprot:TRINITY_DN3562_c0_g1_i1.p3 TRINITY_DN3562_c0_g1~~TRINITY_DN3562_c0_g1_i1.p3  ORF type:complete len:134 (+),score=9.08 TRINITY_DN3562_c0_g1_i1:314-715(+)